MGIQGLMKMLSVEAPSAIKETEMKHHFGRKVAVDASMSIYQFLIAVRSQGEQLTDDQGETTSHLMGIFYRTIRMVECGLKPVYVFDGKPPKMKSSELQKRGEKRSDALAKEEIAKEQGNAAEAEKFSRRTVKALPEHMEECKRLLTLMGIPHVQAPCEAEAQCAALAKAGKVFAAGSEDMDTLCFESPILLRRLTFSEAKKLPVQEVCLANVLAELKLTMDEFIDMCILLGCDYCDSIKGIGPTRALSLIRQHKCIENIIENIDTKKYTLPVDWPYKEARELIRHPDVTDPATIDLKWTDPDVEGIVQFLVNEKNFGEDRVRNTLKKLVKGRSGPVQGRMDSFFKVLPKVVDENSLKRKSDAKEKGAKDAKGAKKVAVKGKGKPRK